jgi:AraC family carnitine catabolism transcriptional activator
MHAVGVEGPQVVAFVLMPEFPLYALVPAIEALRLANQNAGRVLYDWSFASAAGGPVRAGNGMAFGPTRALDGDFAPPLAIVCGGNDPTRWLDRRLLDWLRRRAAFGARLGALDTGAFALAAAGTLAGYRATLHWEAIPAFLDLYPGVEVAERLWVIDRDRCTAAGGIAALDLMLALIEEGHGPRLSQVVADGFVHGRARPGDAPQRNLHAGADAEASLWHRAIRLMSDNVGFPLPIAEVARAAGTTRRTLHRLFLRRCGRPPSAWYLELRLEAARDQLFYTERPVAHVAEATGFLSAAHFSRAFARRYGVAPSRYRASSSAAERRRFSPSGQTLRL